MRLLAIESSTAWLSVCAFETGVRAVLRERTGVAASERVLGFVDRALGEAGWTLRELDGIAYGSGPGAFTGLRIACGIVQGLAAGTGLPVAGVSSFAAVAEAAWTRHGVTRVLVCLDARMHEVYFAACERGAGGWDTVGAPAVGSAADAMRAIEHGPDWFGAGDGFAVAPELAASLGLAGIDAAIVPDAIHVGALAAASFAAGGGRPALEAQPFYVRQRVALTEAERAAGARL